MDLEYNIFRAKPPSFSESLSQTYTRYKTLLNELSNDGVKLSKHEINVGFVNSLPQKWLSFSQGLRNANHIQTLDLAHIKGRFVYEDNVISRRYRSDDEEMVQVKVLMSLANDELVVGKNHARNGEWIDTMRKRHQEAHFDSRCSKSMIGVKSYLHKYVEQPGPKVVFHDNSSCITEGYGSINRGDIVFSKVAFVNGLKYNLISIGQLCDAKYIVQFDDKQGTIFNANKKIVFIAPRRNDVCA
ncbi:hypothetical protein Tco_0578848 [Tanacetum coccineum]